MARPREDRGRRVRRTGIDKRPVEGPVRVADPAEGRSGVAGDLIGDPTVHGGSDQAVYVYAAEDLAAWSAELDRPLTGGVFGENLTTLGIDVTGARIGERWRIGAEALLEVTGPRIPCTTFSRWMDVPGWVKLFTVRALPGAYLRVITAGEVAAGDRVEIVHRPPHDVTIGVTFRALTTEPGLLPRLAGVDGLAADIRDRVARRLA